MGRLLDVIDAVVSRTGYTGEDGFELIVAAAKAETVWEALLESGRGHGILPCGLGARDTLRFEAAMPLYGHELSEAINPYAAGVGWAVKLDKGEFVGREALRAFKANPRHDPGRPPPGGQADRPPGVPRSGQRPGRRDRHLGHLLPDARPEPGDGAGRPARLGARHRGSRSTSAATTNPPRSSACRSTAATPRPAPVRPPPD